MKRYFKTIAAAMISVLAVAACQKENLGGAQDGQEVDVNLTLTSPEIGTKSYGDGQTVNTVHVYVYQQDAQGNKYCILPGEDSPSKDLTLSNGKVTYTTRLMTGQTYSFLFWADNKENTPYLLNNQTYEVTMKDDDFDVAGNNEYRDAFYATLQNVKIDGAFNADVKLKRPFAQLNFGASDYNEAKAAGFEVTAATVKVTGVGTKINLFTEEVTGTQDFIFEKAVLPTAPNDELTVGGTKYKYVAMDYILVGKNSKTLSNVTLTLTANGSSGTTPEYTYSNVPLQGNYRTNIVGNLFTNPAAVNITVAPGFEDPDNNIEVKDVTSVAEANSAFGSGATYVNVKEVSDSENDLVIELPKTNVGVGLALPTIPSGKALTIKYAYDAADGEKPASLKVNVKNAEDVTIVAPNTHVELNGVAVTKVTATTSGNTLVVGKDVAISKLKIEQGTAEIYGKVSSVEKGENAGTITWYVDEQANLETALNNADKVVLTADIELKSGIAVSHSAELNLNTYSIANVVDIWDATNAVVNVDNCTLSISGKGSVKAKENDCYTFNVKNGGKLVINGGDFVGNVSVIQVDKGSAEVYGGNFSLAQTWPGAGAYGCDYMINMIDANYKAGEAKAVVYGGTFVEFNPGDCKAEGENTNFLADGYFSVEDENHNFMVKNLAEEFASANGQTITLASDCKSGYLKIPEGRSLTLDLNGRRVDFGKSDGIGHGSKINGSLTIIGKGYIGDATHEVIGYLFDLYGDAKLTFDGDATVESGLSCIQLSDKAEAVINGGEWIGGEWKNCYWTINKIDSCKETASVEVSGGKFYKFNPASGKTENPDQNWVASGYKSVQDGDWYKVVKDE